MAINGTTGNDTLTGTKGADTIYSLAGNDVIYEDDGSNYLDGGTGNDSIYGGIGNDTYIGGDGNDYLFDSGGNNYFDSGLGNDTVYGDSGNDIVIAGDGNDSVIGLSGDDSINGLSGDDYLSGGDGNDTLDGGAGNDTIYGGAGEDTLIGGDGSNKLYGGNGNDVYYISNNSTYVYDSGGTDTAYVSASFVKVPSTIEKVIYTDSAQVLPYWIDALLPDDTAGLYFLTLLGSSKNIDYVFPTSLPTYDTNAEDAIGWTAFTAIQQSRAKDALTYISSVIGINFVQSSVSNALNTITFANNTQTGSSGYALYPYDSFTGNDLFLDNSSGSPSNLKLADGTFGALTLIHELGHTLGLEHPGNYNAGGGGTDAPYFTGVEDSTTWTVMSYTDYPAQYYLQYSPLDIAALQYLYGPSPTARVSDDTYQILSTTSNFVWDGAGKDTISLASVSQGATVYLTPGYWGYVGTKSSLISAAGQITVNFGTVIEQLVGSAQADALYGNEVNNTIDGGVGNDLIEGWGSDDSLIGGLGNDTLNGGLGNDSLDGGADNDVMYGGLGNDTFDWDSSKISGNDTFYGGMGDDVFVLDSTSESVIEFANEGNDSIWVDFSYSVNTIANVENLFGYGINSLSLIGNNTTNSFKGGKGNDSIDGGSGTDYVNYADNFADCSITYSGLNYTVKTKTEGADSLTNIEFLRFLDQTIDIIRLNSLPVNITGTALKDTFTSTYSNEYIDGGEGIDTVIYSGAKSAYSISNNTSSVTVSSGTDGTDSLTNIERIQFSDMTVALDISGIAGQAYRVYQAAFNRTPDNGGLKYWIGLMGSGYTLSGVASGFIASAEFKTLYGSNPTNELFVSKLYDNVLHRTPDAGGYNYWVGLLNSKKIDNISTLINFSESTENQAGVIGVIQNGIELI